MHFSLKDIFIVSVLGLGGALLVNHYAGLDIGFLNRIEGAIVSSGQGSGLRASSGFVSTSGDEESDCYDKSKVSGDARFSLRQRIKEAKEAGNWELQRELEGRLESLTERERGGCL
ncbi:MAG: hypothetical protein ACNS63_01015 [Candidatus Nitrospinota bacterium M3_3B_026]